MARRSNEGRKTLITKRQFASLSSADKHNGISLGFTWEQGPPGPCKRILSPNGGSTKRLRPIHKKQPDKIPRLLIYRSYEGRRPSFPGFSTHPVPGTDRHNGIPPGFTWEQGPPGPCTFSNTHPARFNLFLPSSQFPATSSLDRISPQGKPAKQQGEPENRKKPRKKPPTPYCRKSDAILTRPSHS